MVVMAGSPQREALLTRASDLEEKLQLTDSDVHEFFSDFSFETLLGIFRMGGLDRHEQELVVGALSRLLGTPAGQALLEQAAPYLSAACASTTTALRRLAVVQLANIVYRQLHQQAGSTGSEAVLQLLEQLAVMLTDSDTGVAEAATTALARCASASPASAAAVLDPRSPACTLLQRIASGDYASTAQAQGAGAGREAGLPALMQPPAAADPKTSAVRVVSLALAIMSPTTHEGVVTAVEASGLLTPLSSQLQSAQSDPLTAASLLTVLTEQLQALQHRQLQQQLALQGQGSGAAGSQASSSTGHTLARLMGQLQGLLEPLWRDKLLGPQALMLSATLLAVQGAAGSPLATAAAEAGSTSYIGFLSALSAIMDPQGDAPPDEEVGAADAVGQLALGRQAAELVVPGQWGSGAQQQRAGGVLLQAVASRALSNTCPLPSLRTASLHALASIAGAERMHAPSHTSASSLTPGLANGRGAPAPASPEARLVQSLHSRRAALLSADSEQKLRSAVYTAVHNSAGTITLAEAITSLLAAPFSEQRLALYRCIAALAVRPWFAAELARSPAVISHLTTAANGDAQQQAGGSPNLSGAQPNASASHWRHAALESVWLTAKELESSAHSPQPHQQSLWLPEELEASRSALLAVEPQLQAGLQAGPWGVRSPGAGPAASAARRAPAEFQIATLP